MEYWSLATTGYQTPCRPDSLTNGSQWGDRWVPTRLQRHQRLLWMVDNANHDREAVCTWVICHKKKKLDRRHRQFPEQNIENASRTNVIHLHTAIRVTTFMIKTNEHRLSSRSCWSRLMSSNRFHFVWLFGTTTWFSHCILNDKIFGQYQFNAYVSFRRSNLHSTRSITWELRLVD